MDQGTYNCELSMHTLTSPDEKLIVYFDAEIELTWFMILVITVIYLVFLVIGIQAVISRDYFCFKHLIYSSQFIHLMSMLAVDLPPPFVYFIQRMSVFAFVEGIFSKAFFLDSFSFMKIDRFYRANYETSSFLSNQILSIIVLTFFLGSIALFEWVMRARALNTRKANKIPVKTVEQSSGSSGDNDEKLISKKEAIDILKRVMFNVFSIIFPYVLLNSIINVTNADFKNAATIISFLLAIFVGLATFKLSLLIILFVIKNFKNINKSSDPEETTHDNLFSNLRIKYMIMTHLIFWIKRWSIILIIFLSPFFDNYYTIIAGFVIFLGFFAMELDYRSTNNKLEFVYVLITYFPPVITSFMAMIMEGHYITYSSKYL